MIKAPFFRLPIEVNDPTAPALLSSDTRPIFPYSYEKDALAHWDFRDGLESLRDRLNGSLLSPNAAIPSFTDQDMNIADGAQNGLISEFADTNSFTICLVAKWRDRADGEGNVLFGNSTQNSAQGGSMAFFSGSSSPRDNITFVNRESSNLSAVSVGEGDVNLAVGDYFFLGFGYSDAGGRTICMPSESQLAIASDGADTKVLSANPICLGNVFYNNSGYYVGYDVSEFMIFPTRKTQAEMLDIAFRSSERMRYKGVTLAGF